MRQQRNGNCGGEIIEATGWYDNADHRSESGVQWILSGWFRDTPPADPDSYVKIFASQYEAIAWSQDHHRYCNDACNALLYKGKVHMIRYPPDSYAGSFVTLVRCDFIDSTLHDPATVEGATLLSLS